MNPAGKFPHVALVVLAALSIFRSSFSLGDAISALLTSRIVIQFVGQIAALHRLRQRKDFVSPFRMCAYALPSAIALAGWSYIFATSGWGFAEFGIVMIGAGVGAYALWVRMRGVANPR